MPLFHCKSHDLHIDRKQETIFHVSNIETLVSYISSPLSKYAKQVLKFPILYIKEHSGSKSSTSKSRNTRTNLVQFSCVYTLR